MPIVWETAVLMAENRRGAQAPYSPREYAMMHYFYGVARSNSRAAARLYREYAENQPGPANRRFPDHRVFTRLHQSLLEGAFPGSRGREPGRVDRNREEEVIEEIRRDPTTSQRRIARRTGIPRSSIQRIIRANDLHPYHYQKVQALKPEDYPKRIAFCRAMLAKNREDPNFFDCVLWTDESRFERFGLFNTHNSHYYAVENPNLTRESSFQDHYSVNLWSGIVNKEFVGPYELPSRLNAGVYLHFLQNVLPNVLRRDVTSNIQQRMWLQHDGATCHFARSVREHLNEAFPGRWIGRGGPIAWPPRSPDLNPIDFFIWGYFKEIVYARESTSERDLRQKIELAISKIRENRQPFYRLKNNFLRRCRMCIANGGRQFEHLL